MAIPESLPAETNVFRQTLAELETGSVDARRQAQQQAVLAYGRRTIGSTPLAVLLEDAGWLLAYGLGCDYAGIGQVVDSGSTLRVAVQPVDSSDDFPEKTLYECAMSAVDSLTVRALEEGRPIWENDLTESAHPRPAFEEEHGIVAELAVPLYSNGRPFGAMAVYAKASRRFEAHDVHFAETIAHLLTASIARAKAEEEASRESTEKSTLLDIVDALVIMLDDHGNIVSMNRHCEEVTKFSLDEIRGRPFWEVFAVSEEAESVCEVFRGLDGGKAPNEFASYLVTQEGEKRCVSWSMKTMADGQIQSILLSGSDHTEEMMVREELRVTKQLVAETAQALSEYRAELETLTRENRGEDLREDEFHGLTTDSEERDIGPRSATVDSSAPKSYPEHGRAARHEYRHRQMIAPLLQGTLPPSEAFSFVECKDISTSGIAFYTSDLPDFEKVVIALGSPPGLKHFAARVARVATVEHDGRRQFLVGCRFIGRVNL